VEPTGGGTCNNQVKKAKRRKKCGPAFEGPHSHFQQTARAKVVLD
jgi:hypothetical protein